jgi:hypothetical protein
MRFGDGAVGGVGDHGGGVVHLGVEEDVVESPNDEVRMTKVAAATRSPNDEGRHAVVNENPYEAPQVESGVQNATKASRGRSVWLAGLCMLLAPLWIVLVIAMVVPNTTPSAARILFLIIGIIPAFLLFSFGGGLASGGRRS